MQPSVLVINPNALAKVTEGIAQTAGRQFEHAPVRLTYLTLDEAPPGIVSQRDVDRAAVLLANAVEANASHVDAFVVACFSDPGLAAARELTRKPVIGIGQAALGAATALGERVGVVAISRGSIARHYRTYRALGFEGRIAGERAIDLAVHESGDTEIAAPRIVETGRALVQEDGADVLVLGCAGMSALRARIEDALGVPVVDPCTTAIALALNTLNAREPR